MSKSVSLDLSITSLLLHALDLQVASFQTKSSAFPDTMPPITTKPRPFFICDAVFRMPKSGKVNASAIDWKLLQLKSRVFRIFRFWVPDRPFNGVERPAWLGMCTRIKNMSWVLLFSSRMRNRESKPQRPRGCIAVASSLVQSPPTLHDALAICAKISDNLCISIFVFCFCILSPGNSCGRQFLVCNLASIPRIWNETSWIGVSRVSRVSLLFFFRCLHRNCGSGIGDRFRLGDPIADSSHYTTNALYLEEEEDMSPINVFVMPRLLIRMFLASLR